MAYRVIKTIKGRQYVYEQTSRRIGTKVRTKSRYIGPLDPRNQTSRSSKVNTTLLSKSDVAACLQSKEFEQFLKTGSSGRFPVAILPQSFMASKQKFKRRELFVSADTKNKNRRRHPELDLNAYQHIQELIDQGERVRDKANRALVIFQNRDGLWWRVAIKSTAHGEPYLLTYHRSDERHYQNAKKLS